MWHRSQADDLYETEGHEGYDEWRGLSMDEEYHGCCATQVEVYQSCYVTANVTLNTVNVFNTSKIYKQRPDFETFFIKFGYSLHKAQQVL